MNQEWHIYTDGGSRGNPGKAACAFVVFSNSIELHSQSRYLGQSTNNEAEYAGLLDSLEYIHSADSKPISSLQIEWRLDSKLVVEQVQGLWKVKETRLQVLCERAKQLLDSLPYQHSIIHVPRSLNARADQLVNHTLDSV